MIGDTSLSWIVVVVWISEQLKNLKLDWFPVLRVMRGKQAQIFPIEIRRLQMNFHSG